MNEREKLAKEIVDRLTMDNLYAPNSGLAQVVSMDLGRLSKRALSDLLNLVKSQRHPRYVKERPQG